MNLLSDIFMSVALKDIPACRHVIRILTGRYDLEILNVRTQYHISNISSHDARLDVLAEDNTGHLINIEIQRADTVDHARRTRYYGSLIDSEFLAKGKSYSELPDVHIIYISETDIWKQGHTKYEVNKFFGETGIPYNDGFHVMYVNAQVDDGSAIAELMKYFKATDSNDNTQGDLSARVNLLKSGEGVKILSMDKELADLLRKYGDILRTEGEICALYRMVKKGLVSVKQAAQDLNMSPEEFQRKAETLAV